MCRSVDLKPLFAKKLSKWQLMASVVVEREQGKGTPIMAIPTNVTMLTTVWFFFIFFNFLCNLSFIIYCSVLNCGCYFLSLGTIVEKCIQCSRNCGRDVISETTKPQLRSLNCGFGLHLKTLVAFLPCLLWFCLRTTNQNSRMLRQSVL